MDMEDKGELFEGPKKYKDGILMGKRAMDRKRRTNPECFFQMSKLCLNLCTIDLLWREM